MTHNAAQKSLPPPKLSIAPMMDWTDRFFRYLLRLITKETWLYTEMVTTGALLFGDQKRFLEFDESEHPIALQLGGSDPKQLAECAKLAEKWGYDEVNINLGCPSDRVQSGQFGACLMSEKDLVAACYRAMQDATKIPVTIKTRLGIDDFDSYEFLHDFLSAIYEKGCRHFILHARKAWLNGLSPKENREIPPLDYDRVYKIKNDFPDAVIVLNGGVKTLEDAQKHLQKIDGVMIGRQAYAAPFDLLHEADEKIFGKEVASKSRFEIMNDYADFIETEFQKGVPLWPMVRHTLGMFHGVKGARGYRRFLSTHAVKKDATPATFRAAIDEIHKVNS